MALIKVKGRRDPVFVSDAKAEEIKRIWMLESTPQDTKINFGNWAGLMSEIKAIEFDVNVSYDSRPVNYSEYYMSAKEWQGMSTERKINYGLEWFSFCFHSRSLDKPIEERRPNPTDKAKAREIIANFYRLHPTNPIMPVEEFGDLVPKAKGGDFLATLAEAAMASAHE